MKNIRLFLLLALLCAAAYALRRSRDEGLLSANDSRLFPFDSSAVSSFTIASRDAPLIRCARSATGGDWVIIPNENAARAMRADSRKIDFILESVAASRPKNHVSRKLRERRNLNLSDYGLDNPSAVLALTDAGGRERIVNFGNISPSGEHVFAKFPSSGDVFTLDRVAAGLLPVSADDIRSRALLPRTASEIVSLRWERANPARPALAIEKSAAAAAWRLTEPAAGINASPLAVVSLLDELSAATIAKFVWPAADGSDSASPENAAKTFALSPDEARATISLRFADGARAELRFGRPDPGSPSSAFVFSSADNAVFTVDSRTFDALPESVADIAERRIFPVSESDVTSLTASFGGRVHTLTRDADTGAWRLTLPVPLAADQAAAVSFVNAILALETDSLGESAHIGIACADGSAPEATLEPGFSQNIETLFASVIPPMSVSLKSGERDSIISLRKNGGQEVRQGSDGEWYSADNALTPDNAAISAIAAALRDFRADSVASLRDDDAFGLTPPRTLLTVTTRGAAPLIIHIGATLPDGSAYARIQGAAPVCIISPESAAILSSDLTNPKTNNRK